MKKIYRKPEIMFENFAIATSIASGCGTITKLMGENACGYQPPRFTEVVFTSEISQCTNIEDDGDYNGICYHNPTDGFDLFTS